MQWVIDRFSGCSMVLIPLYNGGSSGRRNHWGMAVLHKSRATIRVYDLLHNLPLFGNVIELIKNLAESV